MEEGETETPRFFASAGRLLGVGAAIGLNRADRLRLAYQKRKAEVVTLSALATLTTFAGLMSVVLGCAFIATLFEETSRTTVLVAFSAVFLGTAILCGALLAAKLGPASAPFSTSVAELRKDLRPFLPRDGSAQTPRGNSSAGAPADASPSVPGAASSDAERDGPFREPTAPPPAP